MLRQNELLHLSLTFPAAITCVNYQNSPADGVSRQDIKKFTNSLQTRFKTDKILALSDKLILIRKKRPVKDTF